MLVDDDEMSLESLHSFLSSEGYKVDAFLKASEALNKINQFSYKIILTDYTMPEMTGIQLIKSIRTQIPEIYTILYTGYSTEMLRNEVNNEHIIDMLITKPLRIHRLLPLIK